MTKSGYVDMNSVCRSSTSLIFGGCGLTCGTKRQVFVVLEGIGRIFGQSGRWPLDSDFACAARKGKCVLS